MQRAVEPLPGRRPCHRCCRWVMDAGDGSLVHPIVGIRNASHVEDNLRVLGLALDDSDRAAIEGVLSRSTGPGGDCYSFERGE